MAHELTLRELRTDVLGLTQAKFAAQLGVSPRTLIRYEQTGAPQPVLRLAARIMNDQKKARKK